MDTTRIRWQADKYAGFTGYVGSQESSLFQVWQSPCDGGNYVIGEWVLTGPLPGKLRERSHSHNPDDLKAEAERWLEEFASSLGAVFPDGPGDAITQKELAEALDHELDSSWVGGRELAVNVFRYARLRRRELGALRKLAPATPAPMAGEKET